jgi:hypothetical protein
MPIVPTRSQWSRARTQVAATANRACGTNSESATTFLSIICKVRTANARVEGKVGVCIVGVKCDDRDDAVDISDACDVRERNTNKCIDGQFNSRDRDFAHRCPDA